MMGLLGGKSSVRSNPDTASNEIHSLQEGVRVRQHTEIQDSTVLYDKA